MECLNVDGVGKTGASSVHPHEEGMKRLYDA